MWHQDTLNSRWKRDINDQTFVCGNIFGILHTGHSNLFFRWQNMHMHARSAACSLTACLHSLTDQTKQMHWHISCLSTYLILSKETMTHTCVQDQLVSRLQHDVTYPAIHPLSVTPHSHHSSAKAASETGITNGSAYKAGTLFECALRERERVCVWVWVLVCVCVCVCVCVIQKQKGIMSWFKCNWGWQVHMHRNLSAFVLDLRWGRE